MIRKILSSLALLCALAGCRPAAEIYNMKCEGVDEPLNVENPSPRFTWAYSDKCDLSFVEAGSKVKIALSEAELEAGNLVENLESFKDYFWKVTAWNADGSIEYNSPVAHFATGALNAEDWTASWIDDGIDKDDYRAPMMRKSFNIEKPVLNARLYYSAAAYAKVALNGADVTDCALNPGYTDYADRSLYVAYDVKLKGGENVLSAVLGNGFYNEIQPVGTWGFEKAPWRGRARFFAELHINYMDGTAEVIPTDASWKTTADGPYVSNCIYTGDIYDARKEIKGWNEAGFDDSAWSNAVEIDPCVKLTAQTMPRIGIEKTYDAVDFWSFGDSLYVYDFGVNIAGLVTMSVEGEAGTRIDITHGEIMRDNGRMEMGNIACYHKWMEDYDFQTDTYYLSGEGRETWTPSFGYHGFRYVEVKTSAPVKLDRNSLKANYIHTLVPSVGTMESSEPIFNKIWEMTRRTYKNNFHSIITDCPHREKNGWTADNNLSTEIGLLNFDMESYFRKFVSDVIDNQRPDGTISGIIPDWGWGFGGTGSGDWIGPVWDAAIWMIPNMLYNYTGDLGWVDSIWPVYEKYLAYLETREEEDGLPTYGIGDWVYYKVPTDTHYSTPCFYYNDYMMMAKFAGLTGRDAEPYLAKAAKIREAINAKYYDPETHTYAGGTMAAQGMALYLGIVPEGDEQAVADALNDMVTANNGLLEFGSVGSKMCLRMLTKYGHVQTAYTMATKEEAPSWGWWIKLGLTSLPETWALDPTFKDASLDHVFLGDVTAWYVNDLAGINYDPEKPGFENIIIRPHTPEGLDWIRASYKSNRGMICSGWKHLANGTYRFDIDIPVGTTAVFVAPDGTETALKSGHNTIKL
ncbi:MAG: glycoside hydrolase family 78 protein [Bacteroidales bacterium]|nr:glycoside hydrolase family 78 protein [Bacteroidales bacterium]